MLRELEQTLSRRLARLSWSVCLLLALIAFSTNAQVYLSSAGPTWTGACDAVCSLGTPCQISSGGTTAVAAACQITFLSGTSIPQHTFTYSGTGDISFSSTGAVTIDGDLTITASAAGVRFTGFSASTANPLLVTAASVSFESVNYKITSLVQITVKSASTVTAYQSVFEATNAPLKCDTLASGALILLEEVDVTATNGAVQTLSLAGAEPSLTIKNSEIDGFVLLASPFDAVRFENVNGSIRTASQLFSVAPASLYIADCDIESNGLSRLMPATGGSTSLTVLRSSFTSLAIRGQFSAFASYDTVSIVLPTAANSAIDHLNGYGTAMTLKNVAISTLASTGTAVMSAFYGGSNHAWNVDNLTYSSGSTAARMRLTSGTYIHSSAEFVAPSMHLGNDGATNSIVTITNDGRKVTLTGDLTSPESAQLYFTVATKLTVHSITLTDVTLKPLINTIFTYHVTVPSQGIVGNTATTFDLPLASAGYSLALTWSSDIPLPTIGATYPYFNAIAEEPLLLPPVDFSVNPLYDAISKSFSVQFNEVSCAAHCVAANSGPCVSRSICTCKPGFEGVDCACPTGGCPPTEIPISPPLTPSDPPIAAPIASPVDEPTYVPTYVPTTIPSTTPEETPTSVPESSVPFTPSTPSTTPFTPSTPSTPDVPESPTPTPSDTPTESPSPSVPSPSPNVSPTITPNDTPSVPEPSEGPANSPQSTNEPGSEQPNGTPSLSPPSGNPVPSRGPSSQDVPTSASQKVSLATSFILVCTCTVAWLL